MKFRLPRWEEVRRLPLSMMLASLLCLLGIVQMSFLLGQSVYRHVTWTQQTSVVQAQENQLKNDVRILKDAKTRAADPDYLNALARCLGYVGKDETVVVASSATNTAAGNCQPVRLP